MCFSNPETRGDKIKFKFAFQITSHVHVLQQIEETDVTQMEKFL